MKALKIVLFVVVGFVGIFLIIAAIAPKDFRMEKTVTILAPTHVVVNQVKNFSNFVEWEPWGKYDENVKVTISDNDGEVGAMYEWSGNDDIGSGYMKITSISPELIEMDLVFTAPWEAENKAYFNIVDDGEETTDITWGFTGTMTFPMNAMLLFNPMDKSLGPDFLDGLNSLKAICEEVAERTFDGFTINEIDLSPRNYIGVRLEVSMEEFPSAYADNLPKIMTAVMNKDLNMVGSPSGLFFKWDPETGMTDMATTIPISEGSLDSYENYPAEGRTLHVAYYGDYPGSEKAHTSIGMYMEANGIGENVLVVEEYVTDPTLETDTAKWLTNIYYVLDYEM